MFISGMIMSGLAVAFWFMPFRSLITASPIGKWISVAATGVIGVIGLGLMIGSFSKSTKKKDVDVNYIDNSGNQVSTTLKEQRAETGVLRQDLKQSKLSKRTAVQDRKAWVKQAISYGLSKGIKRKVLETDNNFAGRIASGLGFSYPDLPFV